MKNLLSMKTPVLALFISLVAFGACVSNKQTQPSTDYTQLVNPFIGTDFTGNTYPGAQAPFGMVQLSPDNGLPDGTVFPAIFIRTVRLPDSVIPICRGREPETCMISLLCLLLCLIRKRKLL